MTQVIHTPIKYQYMSKLLGFEYTIVYKPGASNTAVDALSQIPHTNGAHLLVLSMPKFLFTDCLRWEMSILNSILEFKNNILANPEKCPGFKVQDDFILYHGRIYLSKDSSLKTLILKEFHSPYSGGHRGRPPPSIPQYILGSSVVDVVDKVLSSREQLLLQLRDKLLKAQKQMKLYAGSKRRDMEYEIGDWVYVKLRPHRQVSVTGTQHQKLAKSQPPADTPLLPTATADHQPLIYPLVILNSKIITDGSHPKTMVLVLWACLFLEEATWESLKDLVQEFPHLHLEDKVLSNEGGNDSNWQPTQKTKSKHGGEVEINGAMNEPSCSKPKRNVKKPSIWEDYIH
ncbi:hypothetical protein L6164_008634 [Bauhinia variegata]|uniref:Uncharacterized protein n=1 Tax=Bauhinia variegata TaxID=167791 RepID=A0ACB9PH82_BAUVA|nr:hypothetical protein L6164_008634 [Bauhinia variegata]